MKATLPLFAALLLSPLGALDAAEPSRFVYLVPHFHPASCGWLTDWSTERNYCANSYFDHLDRVRDDSTYNFAISECNNMIAMMNFAQRRFPELKQRIKEDRVEPCNAFFLEPTINLSGGEALVKCGVEGLRWQQQVLGFRPRLAWMIDVVGVHEQMAQITTGLDLDALVYCRYNPTGYALHWLVSPDGTRCLAVSPGPYSEWHTVFRSLVPLKRKQLEELQADLSFRTDPTSMTAPRRVPTGAPLLILASSGDYSLAPLCRSYPRKFLEQMKQLAPQFDVMFSTPGQYLDAVLPGIQSGAIALPVMHGGTMFGYNAFWIQNPRVKSWYRRCEQQVQAAEMLATVANLLGKSEYPAQQLYHAWLQMFLNMDRNTLWGAAGGMVFEHERSWDVRDRFESVERISQEVLVKAAHTLTGNGTAAAVFNPLNWRRNDPVRLGVSLGPVCQRLPGSGDTLCRLDLPSIGLAGVESKPTAGPKAVLLPALIVTRHYRARLDAVTGALVSLKLGTSEHEILGGSANVIVAERPKKKPWANAHKMVARPERNRVADSSQWATKVSVTTGPLATVVVAESEFAGGGKLRRMTTFYNDYPRIDFETELNDIPNGTVVLAEFPLSAPVREVRRGIPYGFSHAAWPPEGGTRPAQGIRPAVRWSHYQLPGCGMALLDQGLTGREIAGNTPCIYLLNACEKYKSYPNAWLSGAGRHVLRYAIVAHAGDFTTARIPQLAWEFNNPPIVVGDCAPLAPASFVETSDNVIVEALRRERGEIELRLAECLGLSGEAALTLHLPHRDAALTDMVGSHRRPLDGGPGYRFPVRPLQIVTMRFRTNTAVPDVRPLTEWDELVPEKKREALHRYLLDVKGHPPKPKVHPPVGEW